MSDTVTRSSGIGLTGILTILFVLLKAFGYIKWSWFWVFSPLWIGAIIALVLFILVIIIVALNDN